ncbi:MAG TPA: hypothetical protein VE170_03750 [Candidatus Limnocylindria bacterium]|nr:hypothetical protein [Candidatus Limnocylindria bacterium]
MKRQTHKVLIVCSQVSAAVKTQLDCNGWRANWARDAKNAIAKVRRESFDLAVLISTGPEMDVTETLFNLRELREALPIAVVQTSDLADTPPSAAFLAKDNNLIAVRGLDNLARLLHLHGAAVVNQPSRDRPQP